MSSSGKTVRCAIYTRVSTDDQARGEYNSLESQKDICEHAVALHQHESWATTMVFDDPGFSGKNMERPGIQQLLAEIQAGNVDVVVAYKIDRITRHIGDFYQWWQILERKKVHFVSATQSFDTSTPIGMLMLNMLLSFGQFERELTAERVTHKMAERAKKGKWNGGWIPMGYAYDKETKLLGVEKEEAEVVKRIFKLTSELGSQTEVAKVLNADGVTSKERTVTNRAGEERVVGGKRFIGDRVKRIVTNPIYKGVIAHDGEEYDGEHPAIVSAKAWKQANEALAGGPLSVTGNGNGSANGSTARRTSRHEQILKGILYCEECGHLLTPKPSGKKDKDGNPYLYYVCNNVNKDGKAASCTLRNLPARPFEKFIVGIIGEMGRHPDVIKSALEASNKTKNKSVRKLKSELSKLGKRHRELTDQLKSCMDLAKQQGAAHLSHEFVVEAEEVAKSKHEVEARQEKLKMEMDFHERVVTDEQMIAQSLLRFDEVFGTLSYEEQMELLELVVRRISVRKCVTSEAEKAPQLGAYATKIRTSWYLVTTQFYASTLFSGSYADGNKSSHFEQDGDPGVSETRTFYELSFKFSATDGRWETGLFVTEPFHFPPLSFSDNLPADLDNPIIKAQNWKAKLEAEPWLTQAQLAENEGVSRSTIAQYIRLLSLPDEAIKFLTTESSAADHKHFTERRLRSLLKWPEHQRMAQFERLRVEFGLTKSEEVQQESAKLASLDSHQEFRTF